MRGLRARVQFKQIYAAGLFFFPVPGDGLLSDIGSSVVDFHFVVSLGWFGQSGNLAPSAIAISKPQQTLRYTPNLSLMSPFQGTAVPLAFNECVYASKHSPTLEERNFNSLAVAVPYHCRRNTCNDRQGDLRSIEPLVSLTCATIPTGDVPQESTADVRL
jgi:hypothetical protein